MERTPGTMLTQAHSPSSTSARAIFRPTAADGTVERATSRPAMRRLEARHLRDDLLHHLAGAAADGQEARVAPGAGDVGLGDVAHATVELHAVVGHVLQ